MKVRRIFAAITILASTYAALLVADVVVFQVLLRDQRDLAGLYQSDDRRGHAHVSGFQGSITTTETFHVGINSHGYRGDEWIFDAPNRVLVLGDSFTFGEPLPVSQGLVASIARSFDPAAVRVYNAGVSGYGLAHALATLRQVCPVVRPTLALYAYYFNDVRWDGLRTDATTVVNGHLVSTIASAGAGRRSAAEIESRIAAALAARQWSIGRSVSLEHLRAFVLGRRLGQPTVGAVLISTDESQYPIESAQVAVAQLEKMLAVARDCQADFALVVLPSRWEGVHHVREPATERFLAGIAASGAPVLDLRARVAKGIDLSLPNDNHYDPNGAVWVGEQIADYIAARFPALRAHHL